MSRDNVEVLRRGIAALKDRDRSALVPLTHEDMEWRPALTAGGALEGAVYRGVDGMLRYLDDLDAEFVDTDIAIEALEPIDEQRVLYSGRVVAQGRASGIKLDVPIWSLWELCDGKLWRGVAFLSREEALEAAALDE